MKTGISTEPALRAMMRAAHTAHQRAARHGLKVPVWRDGVVTYIEPKTGMEHDGAYLGKVQKNILRDQYR